VLVTLAGPDAGGADTVGIYRIDGPDEFTVVADIGAYAIVNPPDTTFAVPTGVQYALQEYRGGLLVTDGHHNRVLKVSLEGAIEELLAVGNTVPTGLEIHGNTIFMAEAGPVPHLPVDGRVLSFNPGSNSTTEVAAGAPLLVDVEIGRGQRMYVLSQGVWVGGPEGSPASPDTGSLAAVQDDGTFTAVVSGLDRPTSLEISGDTAYVMSLTGQIVRVDNLSCGGATSAGSR
jgi:hypothetical protein